MLLNNLISFSKKKPGKIAFVSENKTYTFEQALVRIQNIASFLKRELKYSIFHTITVPLYKKRRSLEFRYALS